MSWPGSIPVGERTFSCNASRLACLHVVASAKVCDPCWRRCNLDDGVRRGRVRPPGRQWLAVGDVFDIAAQQQCFGCFVLRVCFEIVTYLQPLYVCSPRM